MKIVKSLLVFGVVLVALTLAPSAFATTGSCETLPGGVVEVESLANPSATGYATLGAAFTDINNGVYTGTITIDICDNTTELASAVLNASGTGLALYGTIAISPAGGATRTITGAIAGVLVDLNGADGVTIDGLNASSNALVIDNTSATATATTIRFIADASSNTVQNCTIKGSGTSATLGTILFSTGSSTGNVGNVLNANTITASTTTPFNAIYSAGTSTAIANTASFTNNNIQDYFNSAGPSNGIFLASNSTAWTITGNKFFQSATRTSTASAGNSHSAIQILTGSGGGYTINNNTIGFATSAGSGVTTYAGALPNRFFGILLTAANSPVSNIQGNTVSGISLTTSTIAAPGFAGINVLAGGVNVGTTSPNTIGATTGTGAINVTSTTTGPTIVGINVNSTGTSVIQNNNVGSINTGGTSGIGYTFAGIATSGAAGNITISGNTVGSTTTANSVAMGTSGTTTTGVCAVTGISNSATGTIAITGNTVQNCSSFGTAASTFIGITNTGGTGTLNITSNNILAATNSGTGSLTCISNSAGAVSVVINSNIFRNLSRTVSATGAVNGILNTGAATSALSINLNKLGDGTGVFVTYSVANSSALTGISTSGTTTAVVSISNNNFQGIVYSVAGSGSHTYITWSNASSAAAFINNNTFNNLSVGTAGSVTFLTRAGNMTATGSEDVTNNSIVTAFVKGASGGSVTFFGANASSVNGSTMTNNLNNFSNVTVAGATAIAGWSNTEGASATNGPTKTITNNTFNSLVNNATPTGAITGMSVNFSGASSVVSTNTISNVTAGGAFIGISLGSSNQSLTCTLNVIDPITASGTSASGIVISTGAATTTVSKNKIYDITGNNAAALVNGILVAGSTAGSTVTLSNNLIGDLKATLVSSTDAIRGISITPTIGTSTVNVLHNSVYLSAPVSGGANFGTSGIFHATSTTATTSALNLRNNIIVNNSAHAGTGATVAYRRSSGAASALANYASTSNNNDFYANTPGPSDLIYSDGTSSAQTFNAYKNGIFTAGTIAPRDSASFSENPNFISTTGSNANFLHINTGIASQIESGGGTGTGIGDDFDGQVRFGFGGYAGGGTAPDVGADEFTGTPLDLTPPTISYTALGNAAAAATRAFTNVTVTDANPVNTTAGTRPRVYYKKTSDVNNTFNDNTSGTVGWKYAEASGGGGSPFSFTIDYSLLSGGAGVSIGDTVQYFVVAQDTATTPNVGINSGVFAATPSSVALTAAAFPITGTIKSYAIVASLSGTKTVCASLCDYTSLTNAGGVFADINAKVLNGSLTVQIAGDLAGETGANALAPIAEDPVGLYTVTIYPTGVARSVTGTGTGGTLIPIVGADRVTIDGSIGGAGSDRSLTLNQTNTASGTGNIFIGSLGTGAGSTDLTIKNCIIKDTIGSSSLFTFGVFVGDSTGAAAGADNDNFTFQNNQILQARTGLQMVGTAAGPNDNTVISGNLIGDNTLVNSIGRVGITFSTANNATISNNTIKNIFIAADTSLPVALSVASLTGTSTISGNSIAGIQSTGSVTPVGIIASGSSGVTLSQNTIDGVTGGFGGTGSGDVYGIALGTGFVNSTVTRNTIRNISYNGTGGYGGRGLDINTGSATSALTISNNMISNIKGDSWNSFASDSIAGIRITGTTGGLSFYYNSVNLGSGTFAGNATGTLSAAIYVVSTASAIDMRNNIFATNLENTAAGTAKSYAIYSDAASGAFTNINNNDYVASGGQGVLGFIGALDRGTITAWRTGTGQDLASFAGDPKFLSSTDLHISTVLATPVESAGTPVSVLVDFDGDGRHATTPDVGADEGAFVPLVANDMQATAFIDPTNGGSKITGAAFSPQATFTNNGTAAQSTVPVRFRITGPNPSPSEIYNQTATTTGSLASGGTQSVTFPSTSIAVAGTYTMYAKSELVGDAVSANDEKVGTFSVLAPLSGTYNVGAAEAAPFNTLTGAIGALNSLGVSGPVTFVLTDSTYPSETFPLTINAVSGGSVTNTVTIKPGAGVTASISGSSATCILILNGADYVTIDGSNGGGSPAGTSRDLTVTNTSASTSSAVVCIETATGPDGATNDTVKNLNVVGSGSAQTLAGVFSGSSTISNTSAGTGNNANHIQNNNISKSVYGIYSGGASAANKNTGSVITQNAINTASPNHVGTGGILVRFENGIQITENDIDNIIKHDGTSGSSGTAFGIALGVVPSNIVTGFTGSDVVGATVTRNRIGTVLQLNATGYSAFGILINSVTSGTTHVANNMISGVRAASTATDFSAGIVAGGGTASITQIYFNSVSMSGSRNAATYPSYALAIDTGDPIIDVQDNILVNAQTTTSSGKSYAIGAGSTTYTKMTSDYNDLYVSGASGFVGQTGGLGIAGADQVDLAAWQAAIGSPTDANSISDDPGFVSTSNLHIKRTPACYISPVENKGITIGSVANDFDNDTRLSPPDIGADEVADLTTCDDGNACTYGDTCSGGMCVGTAITCTDDQCNTRTCNGTNTCTVTPLTGNSCSDGDACTYGETCTAGVCGGGTPITCTDDQCNTRTCNGTSMCTVTPLTGNSCSDGDACTYGETCTAGVCGGGTPITCTDDDCNTRTCNGTSMCTVTPLTGNSCSDGDACTYGETCTAGVCGGGTPITCTDDDCNTRTCNGTSMCTVTPLTGNSCSDGDACTYGETCTAGVCGGGTPITCTDDQCNTRTCNGTSMCTVTPLTGNSCSDGDACTYGETCTAGVCGGGTPITCTDDQCNTRTCNGTSMCTVTPLTGNSCSDGDACTYGETCTAGVCGGGTPITCTDDDCNTRTCNGTSMCTVTPLTGNACDDGNACTYGDVCSTGVCGGTAITCTSDDCNTRTCNGTNTCTVTPLTGNSCSDGDACTYGETCTAGVCGGGTAITCTSDQCNTRTCNGTSMCTVTPLTGNVCDDGNTCTSSDFCSNGSCVGSSSIVVTPTSLNGWIFWDDTTDSPTGTGTLVAGPASPPLRTGSARLNLNGTASDRQNLLTRAYANTRLDQITNLRYSTYRSSFDAGNLLAISLQIDIDYNVTDGDTSFQGRLVFEPYQNVGNTVPQNTWQTWTPLTGTWWSTRAPFNVTCPQSNPCTWSQILTTWPDAGIPSTATSLAGVHFRAGSPWPNFDGNVDAFTIGVGGVDTTYDFEPAATSDACDDGDACTFDDVCTGSVCAGTPISCVNDTCNTRTCNGTSTCTVTPLTGNTCDDGNMCTYGDTCNAGTCTGTSISCVSDDCNTRTCNGTNTCTVIPLTGNSCNDGDLCTYGETCTAGVCGGGTGITCTNDQCNNRTCNGTSMCTVVPLTGNACDDANPCTFGDTCQSGTCTPPTPPTWNVPGTGSNLCNVGDRSCNTIQAAVNAASNGDIIVVAAGNYPENVTISKSVILRGAQATVNACTRTSFPLSSESVLNPANALTRFNLNAACIVVDGFTTTGGGGVQTGSPIASAGAQIDRNQILNNRVEGWTGSGFFLNRGGVNVTAHGNNIDSTSKVGSGSTFFLNTQNFLGLHVTDNCLVWNGAPGTYDPATGLFVDGNHNVAPSTGADARPPVISGNLFDRQQTGANLGSRSFTGGTISNNRFVGSDFDGLQGGIQLSTITGNEFNFNGRSGLALTSFGSTAADRGGQNSLITFNCFTNNGLRRHNGGLLFSTSQGTGLISTNQAHDNSFAGNYRGAIYGNTCSNTGAACTSNADCSTCSGGTNAGLPCGSGADCPLGACSGALGTCTTTASGGAETINAENNYWNSLTGPTASTNPGGTGEVVTTPNTLGGTIDMLPFSTSTGLTCPCTAASCDDGNACTTDVCHPSGVCTHANNTDSCDDGNLCTTGDVCGGGSCQPGAPVVCSALDQCHVAGVCSPGTGVCSNPAKPDGAACTDSNACTAGDACVSGTCTPGVAAVCSPSDQCHVAGVCNPGTGFCSNPIAPDGTSCSDGNHCTNDACGGGACVGTPTPAPAAIGDSVRVNKTPTNATVTWTDPPGSYNVYRGSKASNVPFSYNHACFNNNVSGNTSSDSDTPLPNQLFYYLVSRTDTCHESSLGTDKGGTPRPNATACPIPPDADGDGITNIADNCPTVFNPSQADGDFDGIGDVCDNCPSASNAGQEDTDSDTVGDACDPDIDGDGVPNGTDNCVYVPNPLQEDADSNNVGDACEPSRLRRVIRSTS